MLQPLEHMFISKIQLTTEYRISAENSEGKKPLGIPRCRREDNIKIDKIVYCNQLDRLKLSPTRFGIYQHTIIRN
jgi:hypothetical protein